jgi:hypothetical protein
MEIQNNSLIDSVIDYANVKFGIEITADQLKQQFSELSFSDTMKLINIIKTEDDEEFSKMVDLNIGESGYGSAATHHSQSAATDRRGETGFAQQNRQNKVNSVQKGGATARTVAGSNKQSTGSRQSKDPDDQHRQSNSSQASQNSAEINRLKQLLSRR